MSKYLIGSVATIILIAVIGAAYFAGRGQLPISFGKDVQSPTPVSFASANPSPTNSASFQIEEPVGNFNKTAAQIEPSIASKNYKALESYMAESVNVILYASECCGVQTPTEATLQLDYLSGGTPPWNFKDNNPIASQLRAKSDYFKKATVTGTASNRYAVGFTIDNKGKITDIILLADYELITK